MASDRRGNASGSWTEGLNLSRRELFLWLACILFANQVLSLPADGSRGQMQALVQALFSRSIFYYLGWYAVFSLLLSSKPDQPVSRSDVAIVLFTTLLNLVPAVSANWLSTTAAGLFFFISSRGDNRLKAVATVLLALSFNGYLGPKFFDIFAFHLLRADAALVGAALSATQPGMGWEETIIGQPGVHSVVIFSPCSSFHNISLGLLCWVSLTKLVRASWVRGDLAVALVVCAVVILFNATRLYLMALSHDHYVYWHEGTGEQLVAWGTTMTVLLISLWGAVRLGKTG